MLSYFIGWLYVTFRLPSYPYFISSTLHFYTCPYFYLLLCLSAFLFLLFLLLLTLFLLLFNSLRILTLSTYFFISIVILTFSYFCVTLLSFCSYSYFMVWPLYYFSTPSLSLLYQLFISIYVLTFSYFHTFHNFHLCFPFISLPISSDSFIVLFNSLPILTLPIVLLSTNPVMASISPNVTIFPFHTP